MNRKEFEVKNNGKWVGSSFEGVGGEGRGGRRSCRRNFGKFVMICRWLSIGCLGVGFVIG